MMWWYYHKRLNPVIILIGMSMSCGCFTLMFITVDQIYKIYWYSLWKFSGCGSMELFLVTTTGQQQCNYQKLALCQIQTLLLLGFYIHLLPFECVISFLLFQLAVWSVYHKQVLLLAKPKMMSMIGVPIM